MKAKVFFPVGYLYPSENGGPALTLYWLAQALVKKGIEVTFVTSSIFTNGKVPVDQWIQTDYGRVIYIKGFHSDISPKIIFASFRQIFKHDVIVLTSFFAFHNLFYCLLATLLGKKVVWSPRGELSEAALIFGRNRKALFISFIRKTLARKVVFQATSAVEVEQIRAQLGQDIKLIEIPNYIALPERQTNTRPDEVPYILYLGRFHPVKGIDRLLHAVHRSKRFKDSSFRLVLAGDDSTSYGQEMKALVKALDLSDKVDFVGPVNGEEKQKIYARATCLCLPSFTENFGNVVVESLAQATPVIASTGTPWSILETYQAGYWCDNTSEELAERIDKILALSADEYQRMRDQAYKLARDQFDIENNVHHWIQVYEQLIKAQ